MNGHLKKNRTNFVEFDVGAKIGINLFSSVSNLFRFVWMCRKAEWFLFFSQIVTGTPVGLLSKNKFPSCRLTSSKPNNQCFCWSIRSTSDKACTPPLAPAKKLTKSPFKISLLIYISLEYFFFRRQKGTDLLKEMSGCLKESEVFKSWKTSVEILPEKYHSPSGLSILAEETCHCYTCHNLNSSMFPGWKFSLRYKMLYILWL